MVGFVCERLHRRVYRFVVGLRLFRLILSPSFTPSSHTRRYSLVV